MNNPSKRGFSVIELLIVIAIIAVIVSLLIPAVQMAREAARRTQCADHLKQVALACLNHENAIKTFPTGGWMPIFLGNPDRGTGMKQPGGWIYNILPYIEQDQLYKGQAGLTGTELQAAAKSLVQTPLAVLHCPSRRPAQLYPNLATKPNILPDTTALLASLSLTGDEVLIYDKSNTTSRTLCTGLTAVARSDYAGNGYSYDKADTSVAPISTWFRAVVTLGPGGGDIVLDDATQAAALKAALGKSTASNAGIFFYLSTIAMSDVHDGASNTYLCGEKYVNVEHYNDGEDFGDDWCVYTGYDPEMVRFTRDDKVPHQDGQGPATSDMFGSAHPSACNMAFCDGSVHSISYGISATVHDQLGNRNDGAAIDVSLVNP